MKIRLPPRCCLFYPTVICHDKHLPNPLELLFEISDNRVIIFRNPAMILRNDHARIMFSVIFTSWLPRSLFAIKEYMEPLVFALGITITSSQCTFHVIEAISASSLKRLQSKR